MREMEEIMSIFEKFSLRRVFVFMSAHLFDSTGCYPHDSIFYQIFKIKCLKSPPNHERDEGNYFFVRKI